MVIKQVERNYQSKHLILRSYRNLVLDLLEYFKEYHLIVIPRKENVDVDALAVSASVFKFPFIQIRNIRSRLGIDRRSRTMSIIGKFLMMTIKSIDSWRCLESFRM